jgi:hypothetical protein
MLSFGLGLDSVGWITLVLKSGGRNVRITCSCDRDTPRELLEALLALASDGGHVDISCGDDRREHILHLTRKGNTCSVAVKRIDTVEMQDVPSEKWKKAIETKDWSGMDILRGRRNWFRGEAQFLDAARSLTAAVRELGDRAGSPERYKEQWGHPFPAAPLTQVEEMILRK